MSYSDLPRLRSNVAGVAADLSPTVAAVIAGAGTGATATLVSGNDQSGTVHVTLGSAAWSAGAIATVTFATPYSVLPYAVSVDAGDAVSAAHQLYATVSATALTISVAAAATATGTITVYYAVLGGA